MNAYVDLLPGNEDLQADRPERSGARIDDLGEEERLLLGGLAAGYSRKGLGRRLGLRADEIDSRIEALFGRIGAQRTADAVRIAILAGL